MSKILNEDIEFLLADNRPCSSPNLKSFFSSKKGREMASWLHWQNDFDGLRVIRFEGELWFVTLGWLSASGKEDGFVGVKVREVACYGRKADTGYPSWQKGGDYEDVTDWFWGKYRERGTVALPEIWHIDIPREVSHREMSTI